MDVVRYSQELKTQLALFGKGIVTSLQRTMGHYLKVVQDTCTFTKANSYRGYIVAQYIDRDDKEPERTQCVDEYMSDAPNKYSRYEAKRANTSAALPKSTSPHPTDRTRARLPAQKT